MNRMTPQEFDHQVRAYAANTSIARRHSMRARAFEAGYLAASAAFPHPPEGGCTRFPQAWEAGAEFARRELTEALRGAPMPPAPEGYVCRRSPAAPYYGILVSDRSRMVAGVWGWENTWSITRSEELSDSRLDDYLATLLAWVNANK